MIGFWRKHVFDLFEDTTRFGHAAGSDLAATEPAVGGFDDVIAVALKGGDVALDRWFVPHFSVHCRGEQGGAGETQREG